jgi:hypothetical protein
VFDLSADDWENALLNQECGAVCEYLRHEVHEAAINHGGSPMTVEERLENIESLLAALFERQTFKDWYSVDEFACILGKAEFTVREWCRLGRIHAEKKASGRGVHPFWVISHTELLRYQREGLLQGRKGPNER